MNVSAWKDKEGLYYHDFFIKADSYSITNYGGAGGESEGEVPYKEYALNLTKPLSEMLFHKFTTVFNYNTLEHIYDNKTAFKNLCDMATDAVIVIVPWVQEVHIKEGSFEDYRR